MGRGVKWSKEEEEILKQYYPISPKLAWKKLKEAGFNRSYLGVKRKAMRLGLRTQVFGLGRVWTKEEEEFLRRNVHLSERELADSLGRSIASIESKKSALGLYQGRGKKYRLLDGGIIDEIDGFSLEDLKKIQKAVISQRVLETFKHIETDKPILVVFLGDLHIGSPYVDYDRIIEDVSILEKEEDVFICLLGDYCQFARSIRKRLAEDLLPPQKQLSFFFKLLERIKDRILCVILGTHENFILRDVGLDVLENWCLSNSLPYFKYGGKLRLQVGDVLYELILRHQYRFESELNITNANRRLLELWGNADIAVLAHIHRGAIHEIELRGKKRLLVRVGTYQILGEPYAELKGYRTDSQVYMPAVILFPHEKKFIGFLDFRDGLLFLRAFNGKGNKELSERLVEGE